MGGGTVTASGATPLRVTAVVGDISLTSHVSADFQARSGLDSIYQYPGRVLGFVASTGPVTGTVYLQWWDPGDDGYQPGTHAGGFIIKYSTVASLSPAFSSTNFLAAPVIPTAPPAPLNEGTTQSMIVSGLPAGAGKYYFAIEAIEADGLRSQLSAGATAEAAVGGCGAVYSVLQAGGGDFTSIKAAADFFSGASLSTTTCIVVRDTQTYNEQVTVQNITNNGYKFVIMADPSFVSSAPVISPPVSNSTAAFQIANASVTLQHLTVVPVNAVSYGVFASSAYVTLSSVSVQDPVGRVAVAGVQVSSLSYVSFSSITVTGANALVLVGSGTAVSFSSAQANGGQYSLVLNGVSSDTISNSYLSGGGLWLHGSAFDLVSQVSISASGPRAVQIDGGANFNTISLSTITDSGAGSFGVYVAGTSSNTLDHCYVQASTAVYVWQSTGTSIVDRSQLVGVGAGGIGLQASGGDVNLTLTSSTLAGGVGGEAVFLDQGNTGNIALSSNIVTGPTAGAYYGVLITTQGTGGVFTSLSITSMTFMSLPAGTTDIDFLGGTFLSTFTWVAFNNQDLTSININASPLNTGTSIYMVLPAGPRTGRAYSDDPFFYVHWGLALPPGCYAGVSVAQAGGWDYTSIAQAVNSYSGKSLAVPTCVVVRDTQTYNEQVTVQNITSNNNQFIIMADPTFISSAPIVSPPLSNSTAAFQIANTSVTLQHLLVIPANALSYGVAISSGFANLSNVSVLDPGSHIQVAGVYISSIGANIINSSITALAGSQASGLYLNGGNYNSITQSTMTGSGNDLWGVAASSNSISASVMPSGGAYLEAGSNSNLLTGDSIATWGLILDGSNLNTISQSLISGPALGMGAQIRSGANFNSISQSTVTGGGAGNYGLDISESSGTLVFNSYVEGSTGVWVSGSTGTILNSNAIVSDGVGTSGVYLDNELNLNLSMSSNTITAGPNGQGIFLDQGNLGFIILSTNTILSGAAYGLYADNQANGAQLWVTSNTFLVPTNVGHNTYGIYLNGLQTGATIYNNGIYYRGPPASMGTYASYGIVAQNVSGLAFDHNRIDQPGQITGGAFTAAYFSGTQSSWFKFNDVNSTGVFTTAGSAAYLMQLVAGSTVVVRDNIFLSSVSFTAGGSSATIALSANSGFISDYNDWFSSNNFNTGVWGSSVAQFGTGWWGNEPHSIAANPLWFNASAGVEDFHPLTQAASGRWHSGSMSATDNATSPTIDAADPGEGTTDSHGLGHEPSPNGCIPNQGSFGQTSQASESVPILAVQISTNFYNFSPSGAISMAVSTVSVSSVIVSNVGNSTQTYQISGTTITPGSIWVLSTTQGTEKPVLQALFNSAQPTQAQFGASGYVTDTVRSCSASNYDGDQNCGAGAKPKDPPFGLWFMLTPPTATIYNNVPQTIQVTITAQSLGGMCSD